MNLSTFLLYLLTWTLVALTPGPAVMWAMANATRHGFRASVVGITGIQLGNVLFFVCIALGLGTLLATATIAFDTLRIVGALYLLYLGARLLVSSFRQTSAEAVEKETKIPTDGNLFLQGLLVQVTNPKALLFMSALLPQFIDPHRSMLLQLVILGFTTIAVDLIVLPGYAWLARRGLQSFRSSRFSSWLQRAFGAALVFFGLRLLLSRK